MRITTKTIPKKMKCTSCKKRDGLVKFYIVDVLIGVPKAYHPACMRKLIAKKKK